MGGRGCDLLLSLNPILPVRHEAIHVQAEGRVSPYAIRIIEFVYD